MKALHTKNLPLSVVPNKTYDFIINRCHIRYRVNYYSMLLHSKNSNSCRGRRRPIFCAHVILIRAHQLWLSSILNWKSTSTGGHLARISVTIIYSNNYDTFAKVIVIFLKVLLTKMHSLLIVAFYLVLSSKLYENIHITHIFNAYHKFSYFYLS